MISKQDFTVSEIKKRQKKHIKYKYDTEQR